MEWKRDARSMSGAKPHLIDKKKILRAVLSRFIIWLTIPLRIFRELNDWFSPPTPLRNATANVSHSNGKDHSVDRAQEQLWREQADHDEWWTPGSSMSTLKLFNPLRVRLIAEAYLKETLGLENSWEQAFHRDERPLSGARICDVGCGGGILTEALAEAGASVVGIGPYSFESPDQFLKD
ncbi:hypothetical protein RvY_11369-2 [Ramazzottius varieornatus]|uniref:Methyltransferase type 11 domain-containing protein n=1 Tax=Ramazzottius varieornatus TaxID=947166 RepID=A0A1D1VFV4_RAMVA|nr:hypothetical protein RvY_11369-2 [Ramazzottius varieornatus]